MIAVMSFFRMSHFMASANATTPTDQLCHDSTAWKAPCSRIVRARAIARPGMEENMSHLNRLMKRWIVPVCLTLTPAAAVAQTLGSPEHFTDRRIVFLEAANQPRSIDDPFTVIEMQLNRDGEGKGKMSIATRVIYDKKKNTITLENFELQPVLLTQVKRTSSVSN